MSSHHLHKPHRQLNGISLYFTDDLAIIVMDRGENRCNIEFVDTWNALLDDVERNESCKGLISTGVGRFYSNGLDIEWMGEQSPQDLITFITKLHKLLIRILCFPLPTLAALNGHAYAAGGLLIFAHDLRTFKLEKGWICFNEVFFSRRFAPFHFQYLKIKLGDGKNLVDALLLGRRYTAEEAFNSGLVHAIPKDMMLITESVRVLKSFYGKTGYPRESMSNMKEDLYKDVLEVFAKNVAELEETKSKL